MLRKYVDKKARFVSMFDDKTGFYARTGVIDENGKDTGVDPFMASYPQLIDIGVMGHCIHGKSGLCMKSGVECYQNGLGVCEPNMSLENFKKIIDEGSTKGMFQCLEENEVVLIYDPLTNCVTSKKIKEVKIGDKIFIGNNSFANITSLNKKESNVVTIEFPYGKKIMATSEHKFPTLSGELKKVEDLKIGDTLISNNSYDFDKITTIDLVKEIYRNHLESEFYIKGDLIKDIYKNRYGTICMDKIKDSIFNYDYSNCVISKERSQYTFKTIYPITEDFMILLGHYVGNGSKRTYTIHKNQTKMINRIEKALSNTFPNFLYTKNINNNACVISLNSTILHKLLFDKILGCRTIDKQKQLPNFIYNLDFKYQEAFLRGYFCDGNLRVITNNGVYGEIIFNTSSQKLKNDLCLLLEVMNVGYGVYEKESENAIFSNKDNTPRIIHRKKRYRIRISNLNEILKLKNVVKDHKDYESFKIIFETSRNDKYLKAYSKELIIINIINELDKKTVIDINIDSKDRLFITSYGIISHNCALGGRGDVDQHENFEELLSYCREKGVVPNFTSSGLGFTPEIVDICKKYCGAVAISWYRSDYTTKAIEMLVNAGITTNVHYVLGNNSIDEAIERLKNNSFPKGINAVIFLLHKPVGLGKENNVLKMNDPKVKEFFTLVDNVNKDDSVDFQIGFDSCSIPGIVNFTKNIDENSIDTCEGGRYSMYITANMIALPCSFDNQEERWGFDISNTSIQEAWDSEQFNSFRNHFRNSCSKCEKRRVCMGGCPIRRQIVLCDKEEKDLL